MKHCPSCYALGTRWVFRRPVPALLQWVKPYTLLRPFVCGSCGWHGWRYPPDIQDRALLVPPPVPVFPHRPQAEVSPPDGWSNPLNHFPPEVAARPAAAAGPLRAGEARLGAVRGRRLWVNAAAGVVLLGGIGLAVATTGPSARTLGGSDSGRSLPGRQSSANLTPARASAGTSGAPAAAPGTGLPAAGPAVLATPDPPSEGPDARRTDATAAPGRLREAQPLRAKTGAAVAAPAVGRPVAPRSAPPGTSVAAAKPEGNTAPDAAQSTPRFRGRVTIDSTPPGARVLLDRREVGTTPLQLPDVLVGSRVLRIEADGFESWSSVVRVVADEEARVDARLRPVVR